MSDKIWNMSRAKRVAKECKDAIVRHLSYVPADERSEFLGALEHELDVIQSEVWNESGTRINRKDGAQ